LAIERLKRGGNGFTNPGDAVFQRASEERNELAAAAHDARVTNSGGTARMLFTISGRFLENGTFIEIGVWRSRAHRDTLKRIEDE
jgi:hypothetical protein